MNSIKKYIRDLNIVKSNLIKFYYNSASEWLKPDIVECITAINNEIALYTKKQRYERDFSISQTTIFEFSKEEGLKCQTIKL